MPESGIISAPVLNLLDESFDSKKSSHCHLSLLISESDFSFCILDTNTNKYLALQSHTLSCKNFREAAEKISLLIEETDILKNNFKSVTCAIAHCKFTIVPSALFKEEHKKSLLGFNHPAESEEIILSNTLHTLEANNLFTISNFLESEIRKHFLNVRFIHNTTSLVEGLLLQHKNHSEKKILANFHEKYMEIVIINGKELLLCNAFTYKVPEDIVYYILFVYEQLHLNPEEVELVVSGKIEKTAKEHSLLYSYIRHIKFASPPDNFNYSYKFGDIPSHYFYSLFTQYLCV